MPVPNGVMMQYFHWYLPDDGNLEGERGLGVGLGPRNRA
jgi:hypothetical protein